MNSDVLAEGNLARMKIRGANYNSQYEIIQELGDCKSVRHRYRRVNNTRLEKIEKLKSSSLQFARDRI